MTKEILLSFHLGLGDSLICNAIARKLAEDQEVCVLCKPHNAKTLAFMWRDNPRITLIEVADDTEARGAIAEVKRHGKSVMGLGFFANNGFKPCEEFDRIFYAQAKMEHKDRWNGFKCARQESRELEPPKGKYCFVHDDPERGYVIPPESLPMNRMNVVRPDKELMNPNGEKCILFDYWGWLDNASEIHVIDSSFAILFDHLHLPKFEGKRVVLHLGLRPNEYPPARAKDFEVIRHNRL